MLSPKDHPLKPLAFMRPSMLMLGALLLLGGCFRPVYLDQSGTNISSELAAIKIDPIQDRLGHYLETELHFYLILHRAQLSQNIISPSRPARLHEHL